MPYIQNPNQIRAELPATSLGEMYESDPIRADITETSDASGGTGTSYRIAVGDTFRGNLNVAGDRDWVAVRLTAGQSYEIDLKGSTSDEGTLSDPTLRIHGPAGAELDSDDDSGDLFESSLTFTPDTTGIYYLSAGGYGDSKTGTYAMSIQEMQLPSVNERADYLTHGFWADSFESWRAFDTSDSNRITVNISGLTAAGKQLANWAMDAWEMVANIDFQIVTGSNAQITFDDWDNNAYSTSNISGNTINSSFVNIGLNWLNAYGTTLDSYSFQTYIHELGHALGLGHQGDYNGTATYGYDETFVNDSWQSSIMSYFSQTDNTTVNADYALLLTTMTVDNVAIQNLYGLPDFSSKTAGATTWGANTNLTGYMAHFSNYLAGGNGNGNFDGITPVALTIFDRGGIDTLDLTFSGTNNRVILEQERYSDINGMTGNLAIARYTVIENAITGTGSDYIIGNGARNNIRSGNGNDTIFGGQNQDTLSGGGGNDRISGQVGNDTLFGGDGNDFLAGNGNDDRIRGGRGDDAIYGGLGRDVVFGEAGNDRIDGGDGNDRIAGQGGFDRVLGGSGNDFLAGQGGNDFLAGQIGDDRIYGGFGNDSVFGDRGDDQLFGNEGHDRMAGGDGNDQISGNDGNDTLIGNQGRDFLAGNAGADRVIAGWGNDAIYGGLGRDTLFGEGDNDKLDGGADNDWLYGNFGNDNLFGAAGNDFLAGQLGHDVIRGGQGTDQIFGGAGNDTLTGGASVDQFHFARGGGHDVITEFDRNDGEDINLSRINEIENFGDLVNNHLRNHNGNAMIVYDNSSILLQGVAFNQVGVGRAYGADDFVF